MQTSSAASGRISVDRTLTKKRKCGPGVALGDEERRTCRTAVSVVLCSRSHASNFPHVELDRALPGPFAKSPSLLSHAHGAARGQLAAGPGAHWLWLLRHCLEGMARRHGRDGSGEGDNNGPPQPQAAREPAVGNCRAAPHAAPQHRDHAGPHPGAAYMHMQRLPPRCPCMPHATRAQRKLHAQLHQTDRRESTHLAEGGIREEAAHDENAGGRTPRTCSRGPAWPKSPSNKRPPVNCLN